jgi:hypothetical protein
VKLSFLRQPNEKPRKAANSSAFPKAISWLNHPLLRGHGFFLRKGGHIFWMLLSVGRSRRICWRIFSLFVDAIFSSLVDATIHLHAFFSTLFGGVWSNSILAQMLQL